MRIRKGDQVQVISGKDAGKKGRVLRVDRRKQRAIVEGVNIVKKHARPNPQKGIQGGVIEQEAPVHLSNLMLLDPTSGRPTRVGHKILAQDAGRARKVRIARRSGAELDR
ncbi:MAG: 50S ribosomal protein L24 [Acidobacteriota bacterium]